MTAATSPRAGILGPGRLFRIAATAEAITWALLIAGMVQKYALEAGDWGVSIGGAVHGFAFLAFVAVTLLVSVNQRFRAGTVLVLLASAVIPFATIPAEILLSRRGMLEGGWRTEASDDPRDARAVDRFVRWWLARPGLLGVVLAAAVVVVFAALLVVGPPGGREA